MSTQNNSTAADWLRRAQAVMPGLNTNYASFRSGIQAPPLVFERAEGMRLFDPDGRDYIDLVCAMGPAIWGYSNPALFAAIETQLHKLFACGSAVAHTTAEIELAEKIVALVPCAEKVRFGISGSEAVQLALRIARGLTGKPYVLRFEGHYHGWLDPLLYGQAAPAADTLPFPLAASETDSLGLGTSVLQETLMIPWNDAERLESTLATHHDQIAVVLMEAVMCNNACCPPRPGYLEAARALCDKYKVLLAFDEVITGFRMGLGGAQQHYGVTPDLAIFAKALSGGLPLSCVAGSNQVMSALSDNKVFGIGTFNTFPLAMAAALASLEILAGNDGAWFREVDKRQTQLMDGLRASARKHGHDFIAQGPRGFFYTDFTPRNIIYSPADLAQSDTTKKQRFRLLAHEEGVIIGGNNRLSVSAALTQEDVEVTLERLDRAMARL